MISEALCEALKREDFCKKITQALVIEVSCEAYQGRVSCPGLTSKIKLRISELRNDVSCLPLIHFTEVHMDRTCNWSRIIGLDLSKATFKGCILSGEGFVKRQSFNGEMTKDESGYRLINQTIQTGDIVLMEAGSATFNLARYLVKESQASDVVVLNPANLRIIWDSQKKNDKADAMKIACIARDMRPEAWPRVTIPTEQEQSERSVIMHWVFLRKQETMLLNRFFALFNSLGYPEIDKARLKKEPEFREQTINELLAFNQLAFTDAIMLDEQIEVIQKQLSFMEDRLREICLDHPKQALAWLSIPGIGLVNAVYTLEELLPAAKKMAAGIADNLFGQVFLANNFVKPVLVAPAMNSNMFMHPATQESLKKLESWGCVILPCGEGHLACGTEGKGRLLEPEDALTYVEKYL